MWVSPPISTASSTPRSACGADAASCSRELLHFGVELVGCDHARQCAEFVGALRRRCGGRAGTVPALPQRPARRSRRWVPPKPGRMPRLISGWPIFAASEAMRRWQAIASSMPPPSAKPWISAITGLPKRFDAQHQLLAVARELQRLDRRQLGEFGDVGAGDEGLGAAAGRARSRARAASVAAWSKALRSSLTVSRFSALSLSGRLTVMLRMPPAVSTSRWA